MMLDFKSRYVDFDRGADVYAESCAQAADEEKPDPPEPPKKPPKGDPKEPKPEATTAPPDTQGPGGDSDPDPNANCPPWCCLTCTNNFDINYTIVDGPISCRIRSAQQAADPKKRPFFPRRGKRPFSFLCRRPRLKRATQGQQGHVVGQFGVVRWTYTAVSTASSSASVACAGRSPSSACRRISPNISPSSSRASVTPSV